MARYHCDPQVALFGNPALKRRYTHRADVLLQHILLVSPG